MGDRIGVLDDGPAGAGGHAGTRSTTPRRIPSSPPSSARRRSTCSTCRSISPRAACTTVRCPSGSTRPRARRWRRCCPPTAACAWASGRRTSRWSATSGIAGSIYGAENHGAEIIAVIEAGGHRLRATVPAKTPTALNQPVRIAFAQATTALLRPAVRPQPAAALILTTCKGDDHAHRHPQLDAPGIHQAHDRAHARDRRRRARDLRRARPVRPQGGAQAAGGQRPQVLGLGHADAGRAQPRRQGHGAAREDRRLHEARGHAGQGARRPDHHAGAGHGRQGGGRRHARPGMEVAGRRHQGGLCARREGRHPHRHRAAEPLRDLPHQPRRPGAGAGRRGRPELRRVPGPVPHEHRGKRHPRRLPQVQGPHLRRPHRRQQPLRARHGHAGLQVPSSRPSRASATTAR